MRDPVGFALWVIFGIALFSVLGYGIAKIRSEQLEKEWRQEEDDD